MFAGGSQSAEDGAGEHAVVELRKGPHGGRLLSDGDFAVEITIFERGVPPHFRVYCSDAGEPVDPREVSLTVELRRLGGRVDESRFTVEQDYLLGDIVVEEPHSFDVVVAAERAGQTHRWTYPSYEGRVAFTPEAIRSAGLVIETAGPATIKTVLTLYGRVAPNDDRRAHVIPRYPGIVKKVSKRLGDSVRAGEVLAVVQSNESLQAYDVHSPITGTIVEKDVAAGEFAAEGGVIYVVADLSSVWIDLYVYREQFPRLALGQSVTVRANDGRESATESLSYLSPFGDAETQTVLARVELPNPTGRWRPGWFVTGEVVVEEVTVPLAVKTGALQTFRDWDVVFMNEGDLFEVRPLELGRRDGDWVEVLAGLAVGQRYAAENSFIIKADVGKSGASHDH
jgi:cobalt-zinc-cadmium efflux system membrane fusion protein